MQTSQQIGVWHTYNIHVRIIGHCGEGGCFSTNFASITTRGFHRHRFEGYLTFIRTVLVHLYTRTKIVCYWLIVTRDVPSKCKYINLSIPMCIIIQQRWSLFRGFVSQYVNIYVLQERSNLLKHHMYAYENDMLFVNIYFPFYNIMSGKITQFSSNEYFWHMCWHHAWLVSIDVMLIISDARNCIKFISRTMCYTNFLRFTEMYFCCSKR